MINNLDIRDMTNYAKQHTIPVSVLIEVCYECNQSCQHCFLENHNNRGLHFNDYVNILDQLSKSGTFYLILTGGEPFTRKDFIDIIREARRKRFSVTIFSNGTLITDDIIVQLKSLFIDSIHISLYGSTPEIHDKITRLKGSWVKTVSSIKKLISNGINTRIKCPLMDLNIKDVNNLKRFAKDLGVIIEFTTIITSKNNGNKSTCSLRIPKNEIKNCILDPAISENSNKSFYLQNNLNAIPCETILNGGAIDPDGYVYPCNQWRTIGGNVLQTSFNEIWQSDIFKNLRDIRLGNLTVCCDCELFKYCTRCPGLAELEDGDVKGCSSAAKDIAKVRKELGVYPNQRHIFSNFN